MVSDIDQDVRIRLASVNDLAMIAEVDFDAFGKLAYPPFVLRQLFDVHNDCCLVAERSSGLVGYALSAPTLNRETGWLLALAVSNEFRGRGYGRRLLLESVKMLRDHGIHRLQLTVYPDNVAAVSLYLKEGFQKREIIKDYLGPGEDRLLMESFL